MNSSLHDLARHHFQLARRYFLQLGGTALVAAGSAPLWARERELDPALEAAVAQLQYLTKPSEFRIVSRGNPRPDKLTALQRKEAGLDRETWRLEVIADPDSDAVISNPLTIENGRALDWKQLMHLAERHAVQFLKVMTCTNIGQPLGMGLWEGIPLREVIWMADPRKNVRRVFYYGYHNHIPDQCFRSSLPLGRVLEDPPGEHPVILCYKLNGQWLGPENGAPVRMVVPDAYGNKSVKWLQRIVLTNEFRSNDTYAEWNNDTESHSKTYARFWHVPDQVSADQAVPITGLAQVGMSGLTKVQVWVQRDGQPAPADDPYLTTAAWQDAQVLGPPETWGGGLPDGQLPNTLAQIDQQTGRLNEWPLRDTLVHWALLLDGLPRGTHTLHCRTIDAQRRGPAAAASVPQERRQSDPEQGSAGDRVERPMSCGFWSFPGCDRPLGSGTIGVFPLSHPPRKVPPMNAPRHRAPNRRQFLKQTTTALTGAALVSAINVRSYAAEDNTIKIALIGCGGRGTGAAVNALSTDGPVELVAMADVFPDRLERELEEPEGTVWRQGQGAARAAVPGHGRLPESDRRDLARWRRAADHSARLPAHPLRTCRGRKLQCVHGEVVCRRCARHSTRPEDRRRSRQEEPEGRRRIDEPSLRSAGRSGTQDPRRGHRRCDHLLGLSHARPGGLQATPPRRKRTAAPDPQLLVLSPGSTAASCSTG